MMARGVETTAVMTMVAVIFLSPIRGGRSYQQHEQDESRPNAERCDVPCGRSRYLHDGQHRWNRQDRKKIAATASAC